MYFPLGADAVSWGRQNVSLAPVKLCPVLSESFRYFCKAAFSLLFSFMLQCNFLSLGLRYVSHRRKAGRCIKCLAVSLSPPSFHSELTPVELYLSTLDFFLLRRCFSWGDSCACDCRLLLSVSSICASRTQKLKLGRWLSLKGAHHTYMRTRVWISRIYVKCM